MSSELKVNKVSPESGTGVQLGDSGDTITIPSGATITNNGTASGFGGGGVAAHDYNSNYLYINLHSNRRDIFRSSLLHRCRGRWWRLCHH